MGHQSPSRKTWAFFVVWKVTIQREVNENLHYIMYRKKKRGAPYGAPLCHYFLFVGILLRNVEVSGSGDDVSRVEHVNDESRSFILFHDSQVPFCLFEKVVCLRQRRCFRQRCKRCSCWCRRCRSCNHGRARCHPYRQHSSRNRRRGQQR